MAEPLGLCTRYTAKGASSRLRFFAFREFLEWAGFEVKINSFYSTGYLEKLYRDGRWGHFSFIEAMLKRLASAFFLPEKLYIEYELFPYLPAWTEFLFLRNRRYVLNFDDDIWLRYGERSRKLDDLVSRAAGVICANDYLLEKVRPLQPNTLKVPTVVDLKRYRQAAEAHRHEPGEKLLGVWIGTPVTYVFLQQALPQLQAMQGARPFRLRVIAGKNLPPLPGIEAEYLDWSAEKEAELLAEADFGIMPLPEEDAFAKGKSAYKLIQYMAAGLPVIASPVGENCRVVTPEAGFLADDPPEWAEAIRRITDPALREGARHRAGDFSLELWGPKTADFIRNALC